FTPNRRNPRPSLKRGYPLNSSGHEFLHKFFGFLGERTHKGNRRDTLHRQAERSIRERTERHGNAAESENAHVLHIVPVQLSEVVNPTALIAHREPFDGTVIIPK